MQILAGVVQADSGGIAVAAATSASRPSRPPYRLGIAMVHQHFMLFPSLTVAENLTLGREPRRARPGSSTAARPRPPCATAASTTSSRSTRPPAWRPFRSARSSGWKSSGRCFAAPSILILDEPTAVLTPQEAQGLFRVIRELAADGKTTSSSATSWRRCSRSPTRITVLRDGRVTGVRRRGRAPIARGARAAHGRPRACSSSSTRPAVAARDAVLEVRGVSAPRPARRDVDGARRRDRRGGGCRGKRPDATRRGDRGAAAADARDRGNRAVRT